MRPFCLFSAATLASLTVLAPLAHADVYPVGDYYLNAQSILTGIHQSPPATLTGPLVFGSGGILLSANLLLTDLTYGTTTTYTVVGMTSFIPQYHIEGATISNAVDPSEIFYLSFTDLPNGAGVYGNLTCGTDCHDDVNSSTQGYELYGTIAPVPEPSSLALLGTGALGAVTTLRRRLRRS